MLRDWTVSQKQQLLNALQEHGVNDIAKIAAEVPNKSIEQIKIAINSYERIATSSMKDNGNFVANHRQAPIDGWLNILKYAARNKHASDDIATTFRFISKFGNHNELDPVNLRDCYEYIADLMMGKAPKQINAESLEFIMGCIVKIGAMVKNTKTNKEEAFLSKLTSSDIMQQTYGSKKSSVSGDPAINILKVPAHLLKIDQNAVLH